jgi:hypothetical protein
MAKDPKTRRPSSSTESICEPLRRKIKVEEAFTDLHEARHLRSKFPAMSRGALQQFERKAWDRLIDYLIKLPPLPSDD